MAKKITTKRRRRSGGSVAERARRSARRVIVQSKKAYRRTKSINVSKKDVIISVVAGGAGAIGAEVVNEKMTFVKNDMIKAGIIAAVGGFLAYKGVKKRNMALTGAGLGMSAVAAANVGKKFIPGISTVGAPYRRVSFGAPLRSVRQQLKAPYTSRGLNGCRAIPAKDYV